MEGDYAKTYKLKVRISCCHGCYNNLDKLLQKNQGVVKYEIDKEHDIVSVKGNVDLTRLVKDIEKMFKKRKVELLDGDSGHDGPQNQVAAESSDHGPAPWYGYYNPPMLYGMSPPPPAYHYPQVMPIARPPPPPYGCNYSYYY